MMENIFFPAHVGDYYLLKKRIIGLDISKTDIYATLVVRQKKNVTVEKMFHVPIEQNTTVSKNESTVEALKKLVTQLPKYDQLNTTLSSSVIIFKEIKLPFVEREKIALVINYEIEPLLPFPIQDAVVDFIITKILPDEKSSIVLVACTQKQQVAQHLALLQEADIQPDTISVDFFALYGLYKATPAYAQIQGNTIFIDMGFSTTRIGYLQDGQLRFIRILPNGVFALIKQIATPLAINQQEAYDQLIRFGLTTWNNAPAPAAVTTTFKDFLQNLQFTIRSFANQTENQEIKKIVIVGAVANIKDFNQIAHEALHIPVETFDIEAVAQIPHLSITHNQLTLDSLLSFATAINWAAIQDFNLRKEEFATKNTTLFLKQIIVAGTLTVALLGLLLTDYITQTAKLHNELEDSQTEAITVLKEQFPSIPSDETDLDDIIELANVQVAKDKETWFAFSYANQARYLQYLLELATKIEKNKLQFDPTKLTISEGSILLKARVKDYEALKTLERELRSSKLFSFVEPQDNPSFTMRVTLAPTTEDI